MLLSERCAPFEQLVLFFQEKDFVVIHIDTQENIMVMAPKIGSYTLSDLSGHMFVLNFLEFKHEFSVDVSGPSITKQGNYYRFGLVKITSKGILLIVKVYPDTLLACKLFGSKHEDQIKMWKLCVYELFMKLINSMFGFK